MTKENAPIPQHQELQNTFLKLEQLISHQAEQLAKLEKEIKDATEVFNLASKQAVDCVASITAERDSARAECAGMKEDLEDRERFRLALIRLRDCDWVITPHNRMDAVRDISRAALTGAESPHTGRPDAAMTQQERQT